MERTGLLFNLKQTARRGEVKFVITTLAITMIVGALSSYFSLGTRSAFFLAFGIYALLTWYAYKQDDRFLKRLLVFGLVAGVGELLADCWLVNNTRTLYYPSDEPMIACSPLYMPLAWAVVLIQVGYLGWLVSLKEKLWVSILLTTILGFVFIPLFEHWAKGAGWWYYDNCKMVGNTPWYIILAEGMICSVLPFFFRQIHKQHFVWQVPLGLLQGLWIWLSYYVAFKISNSITHLL